MRACVLGLKNSKGTLFNSHILDKRRRMNLEMRFNNGDLKHLLPKKKKKKVMFTKCHIDCPEELILLKSMHNKQ